MRWAGPDPMNWLLIIILTTPGHREMRPVGLMDSELSCRVAGNGMGLLISAGTPGTTVSFTCTLQVGA